jgi:uncharacterized protein YlxW (UPF0749 family)
MGRFFLGVLVAALIAAVIGLGWYGRQNEIHRMDAQKLAELQQQVNQLKEENSRLQQTLAKVQAEEERLSTENNVLKEAIANARVTGKIPSKLPTPPK